MPDNNNTPLTGYPSIDKPWSKYYSEETPELPSPDMSMYDFLRENNKGNLNSTALNYFGRKISYQELFENIDKVASSLCAYGVKPGDIVSVCPLNAPEFIYLLYAINKIGAVSNWIGLTSPEQDLHEQLLSTSSKMVFSVDVASALISKAAKATNIETIVSVPVGQSMPIVIKTIERIKNRASSSGIQWKEFISKGVGEVSEVSFSADDIAMILYTGGSTGVPKGVMLSNKNLNAYYVNFYKSNSSGITNFTYGESFLACVPLFLAQGISSCGHGPLCHSMELILAPDPNPEAVAGTIIKWKPNHIIAGRLMIDALIEKTEEKRIDLSYIKSISYGGEERNTIWEKEWQRKLQKKNVVAPILNGYGMTETSAAVLYSMQDSESGLIPLGNVSVKIVDQDDCSKELGCDEIGELCISADTVMLGYYKNDEETSKVVFDEDGIRWLRTRDLATISQDGIIKITGRIKRIYSKTGSDRIQVRVYPVRIEEVILSVDDVKQCAVVGVKDDITAYRSIAYIVLAAPTKEDIAKERIDAFCRKNLPDSHIPDEYIFVKDFPLTRAGKVDYLELERRAAGGEKYE